MIRSRWQDWLLSVEDGYNLLRSCTDQVFLLGLSMGGVLSLTAAAQLDVRGVVAMSTPYAMPVSVPLPLWGSEETRRALAEAVGQCGGAFAHFDHPATADDIRAWFDQR